MSDRRRRGEDEFASESPWPDDNPNDYRWAQDLAREAREEAGEEERRGRHSGVPGSPGYPDDPYQQPPSSQAPRGPVPPQVPREPAPRRAPVDPRTGYPSGPMPTVPGEAYDRGGRRGGQAPVDPLTGRPSGPVPAVPGEIYDRGGRRGGQAPVDPLTGRPSGPMPTVPAETYDRGGRRGGQAPVDPLTGRPSGPMPTVPAETYDRGGQHGGYPPERGGAPGGSARPQGRPDSLPPGDEYPGSVGRRAAAGGGRRQDGAGYAGLGDPYAGTPDPYDPAQDRRSHPDDPLGRGGGDPLGHRRGRPDRYPEPPGGGRPDLRQGPAAGRPEATDRYQGPAAGRPEATDRQQPAGPHADPRGGSAAPGEDGWERDSDGRYVWAPGQRADQRRGGQDDHAGPAGGPAGPSGPRRGSRDRNRPAPGQPAGSGDRRVGLTAQYPGSAPAPGQRERGSGPPGYGDEDGGFPAGRPEDGYTDAYRDHPDGGGGFFDGLGDGEPAGSGRGRGRRGGGGGGWDGGRGRPRKRRGGRVAGLSALIILLIIVVPLFVGGFFLYRVIESHYNPPNYSGNGTGQITFQVLSGDSATTVANRLVTDGVVASARALVLAAEKSNNAGGLEPGFYRLHKHMSAAAAWALLVNPKARVQLTVTIPEGLRTSQILALLSKNSSIPLSDFQSALKDTAALGLPSSANNNPEGYLYPATYQIQPNATAASVLKQMVTAFDSEAVGISLPQAAKTAHLTPAQVIVVASLAQAEAGKDSDLPKIAEVIHNRLVQGMPLDFDSTVMFALNKYGIAATYQQLQVNSPYNTYKYKGLPPGPIDSPGNLAIQAALHPAPGNWLYFVDVNPKTKDTVFTSSPTVFQQLKNELQHNLGH